MNEKIKCSGCGIVVQSENETKIGYVPKQALQRETIICQRCFRLKHYNEIQDVSLTDDDFLNILHSIGEQDALIVKIVDIFDFNGSWISGIQRFVGNNDILLVGNKVDLLPKSVKQNRLTQWMASAAREFGLTPLDVFLISAEKGIGVKKLASEMERLRKGKDVFVIGCANVGKSTFINQIIKMFGGESEDVITTSRFPGTTLDLIDIQLDGKRSLYDTPGMINHEQMAHFVTKKELNLITPKKEIKPKVYQLNEGQTLFFGGLARLDYISGGDRRPHVCYFANELYIHRTKQENADELYEIQKGELLIPPMKENSERFPKLVKYNFKIESEKTDVVFSGLGWVTLEGKRAQITAYAPKGVGVSVRKSLI